MDRPTACPPPTRPLQPRNMSQAAWRAEGYSRRIRLRTADHEHAAAKYRAAWAVYRGVWVVYFDMLSPAEIEEYDNDVAQVPYLPFGERRKRPRL